jgi:hypothetical protein
VLDHKRLGLQTACDMYLSQAVGLKTACDMFLSQADWLINSL